MYDGDGEWVWTEEEELASQSFGQLMDAWTDAASRVRANAQTMSDDEYKQAVLTFVNQVERILGAFAQEGRGSAAILELGLLDLIVNMTSNLVPQSMDMRAFLQSSSEVAAILSDFFARSLNNIASNSNPVGVQMQRRFPQLIDALSTGRQSAILLSEEMGQQQLGHLLERANEVADTLEQTAGDKASEALWHHFDQYASAEKGRADALQFIGVVLVAAGVVSAAFVLKMAGPSLEWSAELARVFLTLPIFGLSAYVFRESGQHRVAARLAQETSVRLKTFKLFSEDLPTEARHELRADFGRQIFSQSPLVLSDVGSSESAAITAAIGTVATLLARK
ncbi:cation transport regulator ChaB [Phycicoccus badiiscoriae]|uniref:Cation transport regulator ChaB n=1 Tax=Pedococcus badiiscoriae TaxID=642776 RepID=A0A852WDX5_9MICO|nr:hypothetical protein [Pedococcus badiiscoriae]NYG06910.1 cation transport regulator ChaB [Pedococcus badiiscoriae]